jgi:hypothetical protein
MDSGSRTRAVGVSGRTVISAGRHCISDIRQLLQFADLVQAPRPALLHVILGQSQALSDLTTGLPAVPSAGGVHRG